MGLRLMFWRIVALSLATLVTERRWLLWGGAGALLAWLFSHLQPYLPG